MCDAEVRLIPTAPVRTESKKIVVGGSLRNARSASPRAFSESEPEIVRKPKPFFGSCSESHASVDLNCVKTRTFAVASFDRILRSSWRRTRSFASKTYLWEGGREGGRAWERERERESSGTLSADARQRGARALVRRQEPAWSSSDALVRVGDRLLPLRDARLGRRRRCTASELWRRSAGDPGAVDGRRDDLLRLDRFPA